MGFVRSPASSLGLVNSTSTTTMSATAIASGSSSTISSTAGATPSSRPGAENGECQLLGPFAILVQAALGALALLSLVYKRWRERPQRPLKIWAFDVSKQVVGSALLHLANLLMSMLSSGAISAVPSSKGSYYTANPCSFYLLNLAIDTTLGIPILIVFLRVLTYAFSKTPLGVPPESIESGNYGHPPSAVWWLKQCLIYFLGLLGMKLCVFVIFKLCPWIVFVGDWALRWTEGNEQVQVFFVMLFFPLVMNALQYYIIDGFIKGRKSPSKRSRGGTDATSSSSGDDTHGSDHVGRAAHTRLSVDERHPGETGGEEAQRLTEAWDASAFDADVDDEDALKSPTPRVDTLDLDNPESHLPGRLDTHITPSSPLRSTVLPDSIPDPSAAPPSPLHSTHRNSRADPPSTSRRSSRSGSFSTAYPLNRPNRRSGSFSSLHSINSLHSLNRKAARPAILPIDLPPAPEPQEIRSPIEVELGGRASTSSRDSPMGPQARQR